MNPSRPGYGTGRPGVGRYGQVAPGVGGAGGGPGSGLGGGGIGGGRGVGGGGGGGARSNAALQAQQRLRILMQSSSDDAGDDYGQSSLPAPAPQRSKAPSQGMGPGGPQNLNLIGRQRGPDRLEDDAYAPRRTDSGISKQEAESLKREAAKLKDDLDVLSEENEYLADKLRTAEEELKETQARAHELEKQVAKMGEGISLEARLLYKKEQALKQKEASLKEMKEKTKDVKEVEISSLRVELETLREEAVAAMEEAKAANEEVRALRNFTARIILTPQEKEEVVLKRCWLARYWSLAARHGVHPDVASNRSDQWQKFSPLPLEVVLDAGRKAKEEPEEGSAMDAANSASAALLDGNIESMFQVERAIRDLASLKVEEGVLLAMAQHRRPALLKVHSEPSEGPRMVESMDLSDEEIDDVRFKQNWLVYWWRRAKTHGVEMDIANERLQYWISRTAPKPTAHDAVDVERGLLELKKLNVEQRLWEASRKEMTSEVAAARVAAAVAAVNTPSSLTSSVDLDA